MTRTRRLVTRDTIDALIHLDVAAGQVDLVSPNAVTLAQAAYEPGAYVWGLWDGETAVGLMAMIHPREDPFLGESDDPDAAYLWRLLIDAAHQRKGHGTFALAEAVAQSRAWGLPRLMLNVADDPASAMPFYLGFGLKPTGRVVHDELELVMSV
ncbi:MAG: GNAT family N-acetyltransferase [Rhodobacter sp.]|nr:GNAT family N-acetyltransferase [Rhodobacter sp.]